MEPVIRVLHSQKKFTRYGKVYALVHALVIIDGQEFIRKFALFGSDAAPAVHPKGSKDASKLAKD